MSTNQDGLSDESDRSDWSDKSDESENQSRALPLMGEMEGALSSLPLCEFQNFLCVYCKQGFISYQYLCTVENIKRTNNEN